MQERSLCKARDHLEKFLELYPQEEQALYLTGMTYMGMDQLDKAKEKFLLILKNDSNSLLGKRGLQMAQQQTASRIAEKRLKEKNRALQMSSDSNVEPDSDFPLVAATAPAYWYTRRLKKQREHRRFSHIDFVSDTEGLPRNVTEESLFGSSRLIQEERVRYPTQI